MVLNAPACFHQPLKIKNLQLARFEDSKKITDSGFAALAGMPGLEVLWLPPQLTDKAFDGVATRLPGLTNVLIFGSSFSPTRVFGIS